MEVTAEEVIGRARAYINDDHNDNKGAVFKPERWLQVLSAQNKRAYRRWMKAGLVSPEPVDKEFTGPSVRLTNVVEILGVARCTISGFSGGEFDIATFLDGAPSVTIRVISYSGTSRPRVVFLPSAGLSITEDGGDSTINFIPGVSTVEDVLELIATDSTLLEVVNADDLTAAQFAIVLDNLVGPHTLTEIDGGEVHMSEFEELLPKQRYAVNKKPFTTDINALGCSWTAFSSGSNVTIRLTYRDTSSQMYVVRYAKAQLEVTSEDQVLEVPDGGDEYLVLKLAEMASMSEGGMSKVHQKAIADYEAQLGFAAAQMLQPKIKSLGPLGSTPARYANRFPIE